MKREGEGLERIERLTKGLTFGPLEKVKQRLFEARVYGVDIADPGSAGQVGFSGSMEEVTAGLGWQPGVDPSTGEPIQIPKHESLQIHSGEGRFVDITFWGDPVERISFCNPSVCDVLAIVDTFPELAPFGIWSDDEGRIHDPEKYRPTVLLAATETSISPVPVDDLPFPETRGLRWAVETPGSLDTRSPVVVQDGRLFVPAGSMLEALNVDTGAVLWTREWNSGRMLVTPTSSAVIIAGENPRVYGLAPDSGANLWSFEIKGRVTARPIPISEDAVAFGTEAGCVYIADCRSGQILWWVDWIPGPVYTRLAASKDEVLFTSNDGEDGLVYAFSKRDADTQSEFRVESWRSESALCIESMMELAVVGRYAFVLTSRHILRLSLPDLEEAVTVDSYRRDFGFERFLVAFNDHLIGYAVSTGRDEGVLRVAEASSLRRLYELPLSHTPSDAVVLDDRRFALVLRPFRQAVEADGKLLIVEIATGRVLHETSLGFDHWQDAYVAAGSDALFTVASYRTKRGHRKAGNAVIACWASR